MIDFRYHLVSIISIFLALAVGIVLGAGPLQGNLGTQLTDQVSALRTEKQDLNDKLSASEKQLAAANAYAEAVTDRVVAGRLTGHGVVVVALPSADGTLVDQLESAAAKSGATLAATLTMSTDWFDPSKADGRAEAATAAAQALGLSSPATGDELLHEVFARLAVSTEHVAPSASRAAAIKILSDAGLVDSSVPDFAPGSLCIVVSGYFAGTQAEVDKRSLALRSIVTHLASGSRASVVAGPGPVTAAGQQASSDAVTAVRADGDAAKQVSTVDHAGDGPGPAVTILALEAELGQKVGHYGSSAGATAVMPKVAP